MNPSSRVEIYKLDPEGSSQSLYAAAAGFEEERVMEYLAENSVWGIKTDGEDRKKTSDAQNSSRDDASYSFAGLDDVRGLLAGCIRKVFKDKTEKDDGYGKKSDIDNAEDEERIDRLESSGNRTISVTDLLSEWDIELIEGLVARDGPREEMNLKDEIVVDGCEGDAKRERVGGAMSEELDLERANGMVKWRSFRGRRAYDYLFRSDYRLN